MVGTSTPAASLWNQPWGWALCFSLSLSLRLLGTQQLQGVNTLPAAEESEALRISRAFPQVLPYPVSNRSDIQSHLLATWLPLEGGGFQYDLPRPQAESTNLDSRGTGSALKSWKMTIPWQGFCESVLALEGHLQRSPNPYDWGDSFLMRTRLQDSFWMRGKMA